MRDILRIGQDCYTIGGKGLWASPLLKGFLDKFILEAKQKKIQFYLLYDHEVKVNHEEIVGYLGKNYKFLPPQASTKSAIDIFGDHVVISSKAEKKVLDDHVVLTVIVNQQVADAFRTWFHQMWSFYP